MVNIIEHGKYRNVAAKTVCPKCGCKFAFTITPNTRWKTPLPYFSLFNTNRDLSDTSNDLEDRIEIKCPDCGWEMRVSINDSDFTKEEFEKMCPGGGE
jgi:RNase P subunit RPR2